MLMKLAFTPILSAFPAKPRNPRLFYNRTICEASPTVQQNASTTPTSAYIHLPFCRKRCHYCDFPIVALGLSSAQTDDDPRIINYIQLLCREINATKVKCNTNPPLQTVFFGGGTPSLVPPKLVLSVLDTLRVKFGLSSDAEISMEMDPGTFDATKLKELMELGVNRVSLGVQAFQDELLKSCGRAHGVEEVYQAIDIVKSCGVENWSMDIISSLPHQTPQMWDESLKLTVESQPNHVSVYDLQVEQGTKFGILYTPGEFPLPSETQSANYYRTASGVLSRAGYNHYEISSYCKDGYECKHNSIYWNSKPFYGFGLGSASYLGGMRFSRPKKMKQFIEYVQNLENGVVDCWGSDDVDIKDLSMDVVMLSLRTSRGLDLRSFREAFGCSLAHSLCMSFKPYVESGHMLCLDEHRRTISVTESNTIISSETENKVAYVRLSDPEGFLLSNELISHAFGILDP